MFTCAYTDKYTYTYRYTYIHKYIDYLQIPYSLVDRIVTSICALASRCIRADLANKAKQIEVRQRNMVDPPVSEVASWKPWTIEIGDCPMTYQKERWFMALLYPHYIILVGGDWNMAFIVPYIGNNHLH